MATVWLDFNCTIQELKRLSWSPTGAGNGDFNCTIQELKREDKKAVWTDLINFNCTIQELKPWGKYDGGADGVEFQLHHTGIKTLLTWR